MALREHLLSGTAVSSGTTLIAARTGGQGKTLVAHLIALHLQIAGMMPRLVAIDSETADQQSKFGKFFPNVQEFRIAPDLDTQKRNPQSRISHWDPLGEILLQGNAVIDVGANVIGAMLDWGILRRASDVLQSRRAPPITLVVPARAQAQAVEDALQLSGRSRDEKQGLPFAHRVLVLNEASGSFDRYGTNDDFQRLAALKESCGLKVMRLRQCMSELWPLTEREYLPLRDVISSTTDDLQQRFALNPFEAAGAHAELLEWLAEALDELRAVDLIPEPKETAHD
jgi:hypothetical protein